MSISDLIIKAIGLILAIVGLGLLLAAVGFGFGPHIDPVWLEVIIGLVFIAAGVYLVKGGVITL